MRLIVTALALVAATGHAQDTAPRPSKLTSADITETVLAVADFRAKAETDPSHAMPDAIRICRLQFTQAVRGVREAIDAVDKYRGPQREMLSFTCHGYLQATHDIFVKDQSNN